MSLIKVEIEPLNSDNTFSLGKHDVSKYLLGTNAISKIKNSVDNSDFVVGVFSLSSCKIKLMNRDGLFNEGSGNIFPIKRDNARVTITLINEKVTRSEHQIFQGLIEEIATIDDPLLETIKLTVLSIDTIFKRTRVLTGAINVGSTFKEATINLLSNNYILNFISFEPDNINYDFNGIIEKIDSFHDKSLLEVLNELLLVGNSIMYIDQNRNVVITPRVQTRRVHKKTFYGQYDDLRRRPVILNVNHVNKGYHRCINQIKVNENFYQDNDYIEQFGLRTKEISVDFVTSKENLDRIGNNILEKYKHPKQEFIITVAMIDAVDLNLTDIVLVYYPKKTIPQDLDGNYSRFDIDNFGEARFAGTVGSFSQYILKGFLVYEKTDNPSIFTTELKLREIGISSSDSQDFLFPPLFGIARFGRSRFAQENVEIYSRKFGKAKFGRSRFAV